MAKYKILLMPTAEKELSKLDWKIGDRIIEKIETLGDNPRPSGAKKLKGEISYRLRIGDYRALYEIDETKKTVIIFRIRHRSTVYKK